MRDDEFIVSRCGEKLSGRFLESFKPIDKARPKHLLLGIPSLVNGPNLRFSMLFDVFVLFCPGSTYLTRLNQLMPRMLVP